MEIREFRAETDVDGWLEVERTAAAVDAPGVVAGCRAELLGRLRVPAAGTRMLRRVAVRDGRIDGILGIGLPTLDNLDNAEVDLTVRPDARRRGIGTALYQELRRVLRAEGRSRLLAESVRALPDGPPRPDAGTPFATAMGAARAQTEARRVLNTTGLSLDRLAEQVEEYRRAAGADYTLLTWSGATPDDLVAGRAVLSSRFIGEVPLGDIEWEPEKIDVARVREYERSGAARGHRNYHAMVRHEPSGELVAWTELVGYGCRRDTMDQEITLVLPEHRGHRLGLLTKLANLHQAMSDVPELTSVHTWNATENAHMIAINEQLGFRIVDLWDAWQQSV
ncbi:GNAT family N-acetyltransferase [Actinocatenispora thailandica]|uniref:GNAT family N-acetyltransferase n=1 Tax=Actinocatenispora thailandica TaxID=227318 RepID=A0A7R7DJD3_9ACTN|nr:GNAT family N-acetyltransferase [Actinocatenispora thailandica]BCJ32789.1 GNAT family N-acetyltransferase [Actinocatenispora thailandica]